MILNEVVVENVGAYGGRHTFDLHPRQGRPVVLVGGANGAGKTTLFRSILLCLYGRRYMSAGTPPKQYRAAIARLLHRSRDSRRADAASVSVSFQYGDGNHSINYRVTRSWQNNASHMNEHLAMDRAKSDGEFENLGMDSKETQAFIDRMLPRGIADLFFFDGERIKDIAESGNEDEHIRSSLDALLGLDTVTRLHTDLGLHILRSSGLNGAETAKEIEQKMVEKRDIEAKLGSLIEKQAFHEAEISRLQTNLAAKEDEFYRLGGRFAEKRQELAEAKAQLEHRLQVVGEEIREFCNDTLPLCTASELLKQLQADLLSDMDKAKAQIRGDVVNEILEKVDSCIKSVVTEPNDSAKIMNAVRRSVSKREPNGSRMFAFPLEEMDSMLRALSNIRSVFPRLEQLVKEHDAVSENLSETKSMLNKAPQLDEVGPVFSEISGINREIGEMMKELQTLKDLTAQEKSLLALTNAHIRGQLTQHKQERRAAAGLDLAPKVQAVLEKFASRLRDEKASLLESSILECIRHLFHKKNFATAVSIERDTFSVTIMRHGTPVTKDIMSPGELQMYAMAIVWGIAMTSGRRLPFVIDTPLARLDADHRRNLVQRFYPSAARQMIIFSTDSEIVGEHYAKLLPYVSHSVLIEYDPESGIAVGRDGYFEEECSVEVR